MVGDMKVELNFPEDMTIIERKLGEILAEIVIKKYGPEKSKMIAQELEKRLKE
jgi:hypothetical protein